MLDKPIEMATVPPINMKKSPLTTILLGVLTLSALASVVLCWLNIGNTRDLRTLQAQVTMINNNRTRINALVNDCVEYGKTHHEIDAVLESAVNTDQPGMLRALVSEDIYGDTGRTVLLPRGSRLIGQYDSSAAQGQSRVFIIWQRVPQERREPKAIGGGGGGGRGLSLV